jgi:hypothetical protein
MLQSLGRALQLARDSAAQAISLDLIDKILKIVAVILGGIWTYLNYVRGRTFKRRLELTISGTLSLRPEINACVVSGVAQAKNVGLSKVDIYKDGTAVLLNDMVAGTSVKGLPKILEEEIAGGTLGVFDRHRWIEPGEPIQESFAFLVPVRNERVGVRLRLRVVSRHKFLKNIEWNANAIADFPKPQAENSSTNTTTTTQEHSIADEGHVTAAPAPVR